LPQFACSDTQRCGLVDGVFQCIDDPCSFQVCGDGEACRDGNCVKSCARVTCESGQKCVDGECVTDKCNGVTCEDSETCNPESGACVFAGICTRVGCPDGNTCDAISGTCAEDVCLRTECPAAERCNSLTGQCELRCSTDLLFCDGDCINPAANRAHCGATGNCGGDNAGTVCDSGLVCSQGECASSCAEGLVNCSGDCINPASDNMHCGASDDCGDKTGGQICEGGARCMAGRCRTPDVGGAGSGGNNSGHAVIAAGGGGCACSVGPGSGPSRAETPLGRSLAGLWFGLGLLGMFVYRRRRKLQLPRVPAHLVILAIASASLLTSGCKVNGFCLNCEEGDSGTSNMNPPDELDSGFTGGRPDARVTVPDSGAPLDPDATVEPPPDSGAMQPDACGTIELCNGVDDDCDGKTDEDADPTASNIDIQTNASHCGGCGKACSIEHAFNKCVAATCEIDRAQGANGCDIGYVDLDGDEKNGCEYRCIKTANDDSSCNRQDNDCDGKVDEDVDLSSDAANCGLCNQKCIFAHASAGGVCQNKSCTLDDTKCDEGFINADGKPTTGCEYKCPIQPATDEVCNALDDDCDGKIDENITNAADSRIDVDCGSTVGECELGKTTCVSGSPQCTGSVTPVPEICDNKDNNCDNTNDDGFDLQTDLGNCGACGNKCLFNSNVTNGHATLVCTGGTCQVGACIGNFADTNHDYHDGCETACTITGNEVCDGVDNDCNGQIDDMVLMPQFVCSAYEKGVCAANGTVLTSLRTNGPRCMNGQISCNPGAATIPNYQANETMCDTLDNDCDGKVDEMIPAVGQPCTAGIGDCKRSGMNVCDSNAQSGYSCNAVPAMGDAEETSCDGVDEDCNGTVDDFDPPTLSNTITNFDLVNVGGGVLMMKYEASRSDSKADMMLGQGVATGRPCSKQGVLPWTNVTWGEASAACCALNADGVCAGNLKGWRLCDSTTWETACKGPGAACTWGYSANCSHALDVTTYKGTCLGSETSITCVNGGQCATTTGNASFTSCKAPLANGDVFDLSGNVKEWTQTSQGANIYELRGGSYNNIELGRTCGFNFTVGNTSFRFPTTGFRCCYYP
jgi:MYXO-CTERM domain-containing protein